MSSDERTQVEGRPLRAGTSPAPHFFCPCCARSRPSLGRRLMRVLDVRQCVCRACARLRLS